MSRSVNGELESQILASHPLSIETVCIGRGENRRGPVRMLVSVESADDATAAGDIGLSLEEAKTLLRAQWEYVASQ